MLRTTLRVVRAALEADPSLAPSDRQRLVQFLRETERSKSDETVLSEPRILSRSTTARTLERSIRFVDRLAAEGVLKKVRMPGRRRAIGFAAVDVFALINSARQEEPQG